jgi:hypothetical protein
MATPTGFVSKAEMLRRRPITVESRERIEAIKRQLLLEHALYAVRDVGFAYSRR